MVYGRVKMPSENDMALFAARKFCLFLPSGEDCVRRYLKLSLFLYSDNTVCWFPNVGKLGTIVSNFILMGKISI